MLRPRKHSHYVLIVEDEVDLRNIIGIHAHSIGISPRYAGNGREALAILESQETDFIIADIVMPEMNGLELLEEIRRRGSQVPFLVLSGHGDKELVLSCLRLGAFDYIEKPFDNSALKSMMMEALKIASGDANNSLPSRLLPVNEDLNGQDEKQKSKLDEKVIAKLKSLSAHKRVPHEKASMAATDQDLSREQLALRNFISESLSQLEYTEKAMRSLSSGDPCNWELGYMNRVMSNFLSALESLDQKEIYALVKGMNQCFSLYRIRTSMLTQRELTILKRAHKILMLKIQSLQEELEGRGSNSMGEDIQAVVTDLRKCISL